MVSCVLHSEAQKTPLKNYMSKLFYDHLIVLEEVETQISSLELTSKEKGEIHQQIEETVHLRVMTRILDHLPREHHAEFLDLFHKAPYHKDVLAFLKEKVKEIEELIKNEAVALEKELLEDIKNLNRSLINKS